MGSEPGRPTALSAAAARTTLAGPARLPRGAGRPILGAGVVTAAVVGCQYCVLSAVVSCQQWLAVSSGILSAVVYCRQWCTVSSDGLSMLFTVGSGELFTVSSGGLSAMVGCQCCVLSAVVGCQCCLLSAVVGCRQ